jgi:hypothetical protein
LTPAIAYLRRRTVWRSLHSYRVWVGRAIGWWSILYLIFWLVVFALSGAEMVTTLAQPLPLAVPLAAMLLVSLVFLGLLTAGRAPSVVLDRRDLFRVALAPSRPLDVIRYRMNLRRGIVTVGAAVVGGVWSFIAPHFFHVSAPWAAPAAALVALAFFEIGWLRYAGFRATTASGAAARSAATWLIALAVVSTVLAVWAGYGASGAPRAAEASPVGLAFLRLFGPLSALSEASPLVLVVPALLALVAHLAVRRSLLQRFPPRFAAQSLVLTQLQAMRTFQLLAGIAGVRGGQEADAGHRARLLAALHDRPGATKPARSLGPPGLDQPAWRAIAWRTASELHRRPRLAQVRLALLTLSASVALLAAAQVMSAVPASAPTGPVLDGVGAAAAAPITFAGTFAGALGVLLAAFLTARAGAGLLGPGLARSGLPIGASDRSRGRTTPALWVFAGVTVIALPLFLLVRSVTSGGMPDPSTLLLTLMAYVGLLLTCLVVLEKYSSWSGASAGRWEPQVVAALLVALPMLVLVALGVPTWVLPVQFFLLAVVWIVEV